MKQALLKSVATFVLLALCGVLAFGQVSTTGAIAGTVTDPSGALVEGASVTIKNNATGAENTAQTGDNGTFNVPALATGTYTVTITAANFKQTVVQDVKVNVGTPSSINVALEVGAVTESVTITGGGGELLQTQTATVGTTITGRQITELPFSSRDALDLVLLLPGTQTPGTPRTSTVNGLPKGSINITMDGVNTQAQDSKSSFGGGFFTYIRPRIDAVDEVTVSTANPGAESSGGGAIQIKFVTRSGSNDLNGSLYWYHRNPALNANYYFRNRDLQPRPGETKVRPDRVLLNQYGGRVGGPIRIPHLFDGRDKAFFFVNYEVFRIPEQQFRQRTILSPSAQAGIFQYNTASGVVSRDLFAIAAAAGQTSTPDPTLARIFSDIRASTSQGSVEQLTDPLFQRLSFTNTGGQVRKFPTVRLDGNITKNHHIENTWNFQRFGSTVDFLNGVDPLFPGFAVGSGSQISQRFSNVTALRSTLTANLVNEVRFGLTGGTVLFFPEIEPSQFARTGGLCFTVPSAITDPCGANQNFRRNTPVKQFTDTVTYVRGTHSFNIGANFSQYNYWNAGKTGGGGQAVVPFTTLGFDTAADPARGIFNATNFPGASATDLSAARALYATLTGRVTAIAGVATLDEAATKYEPFGQYVTRFRQREAGVFVQDSWRFRPNIVVNYGLRYEVMPSQTPQNKNLPFTPYAQLFGVSGANNLFRPGTLTGQKTAFTFLQPGGKAYDTDWNNFAPSFGLAYSPDWKSGLLHRLLGNAGQTVLRGGYSIAYVREGTDFFNLLAANPGGVINLTKSIAVGNLTTGSLLRDPATTVLPTFATTPTLPIVATRADSARAFNPNIRIGYVQSFSGGIQREITKDMVVEARYVGNRGRKLWRTFSLNEFNTIENNFFNEFRAAQANLVANNASGVAARAGSFAFFGTGTGTSPLPTIVGFFNGAVNPNLAASYTGGNYTNTSFTNPLSLNNANPLTFATGLDASATLRANAAAAGLPANIFKVNPDVASSFLVDNGGDSSYDALVLEVRRRLSAGLLVQANYAFSKSLGTLYGSTNTNNINYVSLRNPGLNKTNSPYDLRHAFKINYIYELPFGRGKMFGSDANGFVDRLIGGWETHGAIRVQSGSAFNLGNVQLVGMDRKELQKAIEIRKDPNRIVFFLPSDIILNTRRAFNTNATGFSALGTPTGRFIAPPGFGGCAQRFAGDCGFSNLVISGPRFVRVDMSVVKKIRLTEKTNVEMRGEFLNAINNQNFRIGASQTAEVGAISGATLGAATFGQTTVAYQDVSTTNDPGGRLVQLVLRINF